MQNIETQKTKSNYGVLRRGWNLYHCQGFPCTPCPNINLFLTAPFIMSYETTKSLFVLGTTAAAFVSGRLYFQNPHLTSLTPCVSTNPFPLPRWPLFHVLHGRPLLPQGQLR